MSFGKLRFWQNLLAKSAKTLPKSFGKLRLPPLVDVILSGDAQSKIVIYNVLCRRLHF